MSQIPELLRWAVTNGIRQKVIEDTGTGKNMNRQGIQTIIRGIESGETKQVVCVCMNRLGRNAAQVWGFIKLCLDRGVKLICLREGLDLSTPMGRAMAQIAAVFAELDNEMRSDSVRAGLDAAKAKAEAEGRPWRMGGSRKGHSLKVTADQAASIAHLHSLGRSYRKIAAAVGLTDHTVAEIIKHPRTEYVTRKEQAERLRRKN